MWNGRKNHKKAGWRVPSWCAEVDCGRSFAYELIKENKISSVKLGAMRIITTPPAQFLASLAEQQAEKVA